jgi:uncharacterized protein (TIGR03083 family)
MRTQRYLECLTADYARLRDVAAKDLDAPVPTCPGWSVRDLVRHVAQVYLHKAESIRRRELPQPWPPALDREEPLALLDRAWSDLRGEFARHSPDAPAYTWHEPDQTVGFWIRRMAQETVVHRLDAELALGVEIAPIPEDLALDGVDEVLQLFLDYGSKRWPDGFVGVLPPAAAPPVHVVSGAQTWIVTVGRGRVDVTGPSTAAEPAIAEVSGDPAEVLRWLWARGGSGVIVSGDDTAIALLRNLLSAATQ